jgi:hypothetical protein
VSETVTTEDVRLAYQAAKPRWNVPSADDCESLACILTMYRSVNAISARPARPPDADGQRRLERVDRVRKAIGTLIVDLPELADRATTRTGGKHADCLTDLLTAARRAAGLWPELDGSLRRFDSRCWWKLTADCIAGQALAHWRGANPGRKIGKPMSEEQPATKAMQQLLRLAGHGDMTLGQIAKHFSRDQSAFAILDAQKS